MCLLWLENRECRVPDRIKLQKAPRVKLQDGWSRAVPVFDDERLVSCAGLVPVMGLAERTGLSVKGVEKPPQERREDVISPEEFEREKAKVLGSTSAS